MWLADQDARHESARTERAAKLLAHFDFSGRLGPNNYASVSLAQQTKFQEDFREQLEAVVARLSTYKDRDSNAWLSPDDLLPPRPARGPYQPGADLRVFVSEAYRKSRALVPAWLGQRGWMEFPAHRVVAGEAGIAHELVHVLFPNGNRMLAEGLAIYLQNKLFPAIPVFPNFACPMEALVADFLRTRYPSSPSHALWNMDLDALEKISTPDKLRLRIGTNVMGGTAFDLASPPDEEKAIYAIVGALVEFLLENPIGDDLLSESNFGSLYNATPLRPLERDSGIPDRWQRCYQGNGRSYSFTELGLLWKTYMHFILFRGTSAEFATPIPEDFAQISAVANLCEKLDHMVGRQAAPEPRANKRKTKFKARSASDSRRWPEGVRKKSGSNARRGGRLAALVAQRQ
ncbi:MAG TPA: hypothetical protein VIY51_09495 [Xanthobacteraceae bacterium]